jgi:hypothetical protein
VDRRQDKKIAGKENHKITLVNPLKAYHLRLPAIWSERISRDRHPKPILKNWTISVNAQSDLS